MSKPVAIALLLLLAMALRAWDFPPRYELRHMDETAYLAGSLHLLEGMVPPYKYSPGGPQTWAGWAYAGVQSAKYFFDPTAEERAVDARVRPFVATNHAIWDAYADMGPLRAVWVLVALPFALWAVAEAFLLGVYAVTPCDPVTPAGAEIAADAVQPPNDIAAAAGFLVGGMVALMPLFIQLGNEGRPYIMGWSCGIIAVSLAMRRSDRRARVLSAVMMGVAVASRIDMLMLLPVVWSDLFARRREHRFLRSFFTYHAIAAVVALLLAPWILTNLIGNLRIIATVRLSQPAGGEVPLIRTLRDFGWTQGMWLLPLLALIGAVMQRPGERFPRPLLAAYVIFSALSILKATGFGLQHQGGPLVVLLVTSAFALPVLRRLDAKVVWIIVAAALLLPAVQSIRAIHARHQNDVSDGPAFAWIEQNVPAGTRLYTANALHNPIPTRASSDALWAEVNDDGAWERKFRAGLERFNLSADQIPRALSEENMLVEKGLRRGWFILGSRGDIARPRYDIHYYWASLVFVHDVRKEFDKDGGVILLRGRKDSPEVAGLTPVAQWDSPGKQYGVYIFASPDVKLQNRLATTSPATTTTAPTP